MSKPIRPTTPAAHLEVYAKTYRIAVEVLPDVFARLGFSPSSQSHGLDILHRADVLTGTIIRAGTAIAEGRVTEGLDDLTASLVRVKDLDPHLWLTRTPTREALEALLTANGHANASESAEKYAASCDGRRMAVALLDCAGSPSPN